MDLNEIATGVVEESGGDRDEDRGGAPGSSAVG